MASLLDVAQSFGLLRNNAQKQAVNVQNAEKNYLTDPQAAITAVNQYDPATAIQLHDKMIADQTATQASHLDDLTKAFSALRSVRDTGGDVNAAVKQIGPVFGLQGPELDQWAQALHDNPHLIDALDAKAQDEREKLMNVGPGASIVKNGQAIYTQPSVPKGVIVPAGGMYLPPGVGGAPGGAPAAGGPPSAGFTSFYNNFLAPTEGGYASRDGYMGSPVNFGVNQKANPDVNVKNLTQPQAAQLIHDRYWTPSGADQITDPALQAVHADTAVNMGVKVANQMLAQSGGNPQKYLALRQQRYNQIGGPNLPTWTARNQKLAAYVSGAGAAPTGAPAGMPAGAVFNPKAAAPGSTLDPDTANFFADQVLAGGKMPTTGFGGAAMRSQIMNAIVARAHAQGLNPSDVLANAADNASLTKSLENQTKIFGQVTTAERAAISNGDLFLQISKAAPGQTQYPIANKLIQLYGGHTGNTQVRAMNAAAEVFAQEYGKAISGAAGGSAALTVSAAEHARSLLAQADTPQAKAQIMQTLQADMHNRITGFVGTMNATRQAIRKVGSSAPGQAPPATVKAAGALKKRSDGSYDWSPQ